MIHFGTLDRFARQQPETKPESTAQPLPAHPGGRDGAMWAKTRWRVPSGWILPGDAFFWRGRGLVNIGKKKYKIVKARRS